jgi:hypothetical protein
VAYDTLARRSELAALQVNDLVLEDDRSGTVLIQRSKTNQEGLLAAVKTRVLMALTCRWMLVDVKLAGIVAARLRGWCRRARGRPGRYAPPAAVPCGHP